MIGFGTNKNGQRFICMESLPVVYRMPIRLSLGAYPLVNG